MVKRCSGSTEEAIAQELILSGFPGDQRKRLWDKLHCFTGIMLVNKVTKAKWSAVLDTEVSSENSSQGRSKVISYLVLRGGKNLANDHEQAEKKIFMAISHQLFPKGSNDGVNKGTVLTSRCIITLSVAFHNSVHLWTDNASVWY